LNDARRPARESKPYRRASRFERHGDLPHAEKQIRAEKTGEEREGNARERKN
jgi:hypothetical protein